MSKENNTALSSFIASVMLILTTMLVGACCVACDQGAKSKNSIQKTDKAASLIDPKKSDVNSSSNPSSHPLSYRVISFAPSITETIFAIGADKQLRAVTEFCHYPDGAINLPSIGGYYNPNYELVTSLQPDLVLLLAEHEQAQTRLNALGVKWLAVDHQTLGGIIHSFKIIGEALGKSTAGNQMAQTIENQISRIKKMIKGQPHPRVLVSVGRDLSNPYISSINAAGHGTMFDEIIKFSGGTNVVANISGYPVMSLEGIIGSAPDIIIELITSTESLTKAETQWQEVLSYTPSRKAKVYIFSQDYAVIPGPRTGLLIRDVAQAIQPEVDWSGP